MPLDRIASIVNVLAWIFVIGLLAHRQNQFNAEMERMSQQQRINDSVQMERERAFMRWTVTALNAEREARNAPPILAPDAIFEEASSPDLLCLQAAIEVFPEVLLDERSFNCSFSIPGLEEATSRRH